MSGFADLKVRWLFKATFFFSLSGLAVAIVAGAGLWYTLWPTLPDVETLRSIELQTPLRIYSRDGKLIREFGEKRRVPLTVAEIPDGMKHAVIATEDRNFYRHKGVDPIGIARAVLFIIREGRKGPGGSTITMQVARNFFLDRGKTYARKLTEIMLAFKIEQQLTKDEILELYLNKIFMGHRAYGVGAAAQVYYGKTIDELTLAQLAMIAGLPQRPSDFNPVSNAEKAKERRDHVLWRMREEGRIDAASYQAAKAEPLTAELHDPPVEVQAPYLAEMVRLEIKRRYGEAVFAKGYKVYTSIDSPMQAAADNALRKALVEYDRRHGWRGPELRMTLGDATPPPRELDRLLADIPHLGGLAPAIVLTVGDEAATAYVKRIGAVTIEWPQMRWAREKITVNRIGKKPKKPADVIARGDVVRVQRITVTNKKMKQTRDVWALSQLPEVEGALVALDPMDGRVVALSGGLDFNRSKFNRVTQARRQPGSSFKPFIYSAAIEKGLTAATTINDAPVVFNESDHADTAWRPKNSSGKSYGPTRLRTALINSRNLVSIRLLDRIGIDYALQHVERFGLDASKLPRDLSLSLGSGAITPMELATGYSVLANGGFGVTPYFISRVETANGEVLDEAAPLRACPACLMDDAHVDNAGDNPFPPPKPSFAPRTLAAENAWIMYSMMKDVIRHGTGKRAAQLKRKDLAGKTGTTNEGRDAWFSGFNGTLVATAWVGFDRLQPLGRREYGGKAALPMWMYFMDEALKGVPETPLAQPEKMVRLRINPETGLLAKAGDPDAIFETFRPDHAPARHSGRTVQLEAQEISRRIW
ncbi:MAG: PBP1A family penicillin-binding protein [Gammaproteobacteria bacterium]|nr:PBP1A family penicillin-binding protein [Gammaproteobacteria bacterium]